jgi:hypothetical protein
MTNRPKQIGTHAETAVVRYARTFGFGQAERRALAGSADLGDVLLCPGVVIEVKAGKAAETASDALISDWLAETEKERRNAGAAHGLLVTKRKAYGPTRAGLWWAHWHLADLPLPIGLWHDRLAPIPVRMQLVDALSLLRAHGYGDPLPALELDAVPRPEAVKRLMAGHGTGCGPECGCLTRPVGKGEGEA